MKLNKYILGAAALFAAGYVSAQTVTLKGEVDYSTDALKQQFTAENKEATDAGKVYAGIHSDAKTKVDLSVTAANFEFNLGVKLNSSAGDEGMDGKYTDYTDDYDGTPFYQGNMKIGFFNDQLNVRTGKFESFHAGYIPLPAISDDPIVSYFASAKMGQYFTAVEASPYAVNGLKVMVGLPILPVGGNSVQNDVAANQWKNLIKKVSFAAAYIIPGTKIELDAGFRPGTYYTGVKAFDGEVSEDFTKNFFSEGFIGAKMPGLVEGIDMNATLDIRFRDAEYVKTNGKTEEHTAFFFAGTYNAKINLISFLPMAAELNVFYADDDYIKADEKAFGATLKFNADYKIPETQWQVGAELGGKYAVDAMGTYGSSAYFEDLTVTDDHAKAVGGAKTNNYIAYSIEPFAQYNLGNGYLRMGLRLQQSIAKNEDDTNSVFSYSIPVGIKFKF